MSKLAKRQHAVKSPAETRGGRGAALTALIIPIIKLKMHFSRAGEAIAATGSQTLARWLALEMVANAPATVAQVARGLDLTRQSVQRIADLLEQDGLTEYVDNPVHQRSRLVRITAHGRQVLRTIQGAQRAWADGIAAEIGESNLRHAGSVIDDLTRALTEQKTLGRDRNAKRRT
jgi:DNA-binding MarR family transcriptional regulator